MTFLRLLVRNTLPSSRIMTKVKSEQMKRFLPILPGVKVKHSGGWGEGDLGLLVFGLDWAWRGIYYIFPRSFSFHLVFLKSHFILLGLSRVSSLGVGLLGKPIRVRLSFTSRSLLYCA